MKNDVMFKFRCLCGGEFDRGFSSFADVVKHGKQYDTVKLVCPLCKNEMLFDMEKEDYQNAKHTT